MRKGEGIREHMDLKIGRKIMELRRAKSMTQEQLAAELGVSAPAVSKWETDNSYPDITLLCPLARALGTDVDSLLAFEEELSEETQAQYMTEIVRMAQEGAVPEAEERLNRLLHSYPSNVSLKFSAVAALSLFEMSQTQSDGEDKARWKNRKKELCQAVYDSGNPSFFLPSVSMLVSLSLEDNDLEKAEELLGENLTNTADFTTLWVRLYLKKGERDKALETVQRELYSLVGRVQNCLINMLGEEMALEQEKRVEVCNVLQQITESFCVGGGMGADVLAEVYLRDGDTGRALDYLERLTDRLTSPILPPNPLLFAPAVAPKQTDWSRELRMAILQGLNKDACFEPLRENERFRALAGRLAESLEG